MHIIINIQLITYFTTLLHLFLNKSVFFSALRSILFTVLLVVFIWWSQQRCGRQKYDCFQENAVSCWKKNQKLYKYNSWCIVDKILIIWHQSWIQPKIFPSKVQITLITVSKPVSKFWDYVSSKNCNDNYIRLLCVFHKRHRWNGQG